MKFKIDPDQFAMLISDMEHGEFTSCIGYECDNCPLSKELPVSVVKHKMTLCNMLVTMSMVLNEVEYE